MHERFPAGKLMHTEARLFGAILLAAGPLAVFGCTAASTSVASPSSAPKCENTASNQPAAFPSEGGRGVVSIAAGRECTWSVSADASWIVISGSRTGQGDGVVNYTVSANPLPSARAASLSVDSLRLPLSQGPAPCAFTVSPTDLSAGAEGGTLSLGVSTLAGCAWTAASHAPWIQPSRSAGDATTTIDLAIEPNAGAPREGTVSVAGRTVTVRQSSASATPAPPSPPAPPPPAPSPSPSPSPTPSPTPLPAQNVQFEGVVSNLGGSCPNVTFVVAGRVVVADRRTDFRRGDCRDLSNGDRVEVRGTTTTGSPVNATRIEFSDDDD